MSQIVYQAHEGYAETLAAELARLGSAVSEVRGPLVLASAAPERPAFAANVWFEPQWIPVDSIGDAAKKLKHVQRNWALAASGHHRRAALIQEKLPKVAARPLAFGETPPDAPLGSWTLWERDLVLASAGCESPVPNGAWHFVEDRTGPPSRAYLKLWELFTRLGCAPGPGELCLDMGASPGGWSFVAAKLGARVFAVDKAPLDPRVSGLANVEHCAGSGFGLDPRHAGRIDWLLSDMACYPKRLHALVSRWLELGEVANFACTLKFQHDTDFETLDAFRAIPGSQLIHLAHNKHEVTWVLCRG